MKQLKTVFFGTPDFSLPTLKSLHDNPSIDLVAVITMPDRKSGRGQKMQAPPVANFAKENSIKLIQTANINKDVEALDQIQNIKADLFIVLAFAQFLNSKLLDLPQIGCFNIHTSLLPKFRGAAPIQYAIMNGDSSTGVSIQRMVKKMDAGDIVKLKPVEIGATETGGELYDKLMNCAPEVLNEFIQDVLDDNIKSTPQNHSEATFAPTLKKSDGLLLFAMTPVSNLMNKVRALKPWPGTYCFLEKKRLKVLELIKDSQELSPGQCSIDYNTISVGCLDGSVRLKTVQLEGKKPSSDTELLNGLKNISIQYIINPDIEK